MLYDTHAHLDDKKIYPEINNILANAQQADLGYINTIGCDWKTSLMSVYIAEKYSTDQLHIYAAVGVHPHEAKDIAPDHMEKLYELAQNNVVVAWGEIGLDYYHNHSPKEVQRQAFISQIDAAKQLGLPIVIHDRDAHQDVINILKKEHAGINGGIIHCFSGSWEHAKECLNMGFYISFAGPLTFRNARVPVEVASKLPLDRILIETDSPYLSPHPYRGEVNEPARVLHVAERLSEIRGLDLDKIEEITTANAKTIFRIPPNK